MSKFVLIAEGKITRENHESRPWKLTCEFEDESKAKALDRADSILQDEVSAQWYYLQKIDIEEAKVYEVASVLKVVLN